MSVWVCFHSVQRRQECDHPIWNPSTPLQYAPAAQRHVLVWEVAAQPHKLFSVREHFVVVMPVVQLHVPLVAITAEPPDIRKPLQRGVEHRAGQVLLMQRQLFVILDVVPVRVVASVRVVDLELSRVAVIVLDRVKDTAGSMAGSF